MTNPKIRDTKLNVGKKPVKELLYTGKYERMNIKKIYQKVSDELKANNVKGQVMCSLMYPKGWRSGPATIIGKPVILHANVDYYGEDDDDEPNKFKQFAIFIIPAYGKKGGCSGLYNECLFDCLYQILQKDLPWKCDKELKQFLGLKINEKVHLDLIKKVETKLPKHKINVSGDHIYTSVKKSPHTIEIKLLQGHYSLKNKPLIQKGIAYEEKAPMIYQRDEYKYKVFDGLKIKTISFETFKNIRQNPRTSSYVLIHCDENLTLEQTFTNFVVDADKLKIETNGLINLYKTGSNLKTAMKLFYDMNKSLVPDTINQDEMFWIESSKCGPLIWCEQYEGECYKYDYVSNYPSIMADSKMLFPIRRGTFHMMTDKEFDELKFFPIGIYRCEVTVTKPKLFRENPKNYYTHIDLTRAKELGFSIELTQDKTPNALLYTRDQVIQGHYLFGDFVDVLFKLKKNGMKRAKGILNILWGALSQKNEMTLIIDESDDEPSTIEEDRTIMSINPLNEKKTIVKFVKNDYAYETPYARIAPFLLAKGRVKISKAIVEAEGSTNIKNIKRVHTDSMYATKKLDIVTGTNLGNMKFEGFCKNVKIFNNIKITGKFN